MCCLIGDGILIWVSFLVIVVVCELVGWILFLSLVSVLSVGV